MIRRKLYQFSCWADQFTHRRIAAARRDSIAHSIWIELHWLAHDLAFLVSPIRDQLQA